jgi:nucleoside-triphosphatase THEP1
MVIIITGATGIGKTTVCEKVIRAARSRGHSCGGVITRKARNGDIVIEDVRTGETRVLASTRGIYQGPRTTKYFFNPEGIDFGIQAIDRGISSDIILVDELGPIELRGEGFTKVIRQIGAGKVRNCIVVIRKELLSAFLPQLGTAPPVFEVTSDNRNELPGEIGLVLTRAVTAE